VHGLEHPWVFAKPLPAPIETRTPGHRQGFSWVRVRVALENPRVARAIPYESLQEKSQGQDLGILLLMN